MGLEYKFSEDLIITQGDLQEHKLKKLFPLFQTSQVLFPCIIYDGKIVDGHHRSTLGNLFGVPVYQYFIDEEGFSKQFFYEMSALVPIKDIVKYAEQAEDEVKRRIEIIDKTAKDWGHKTIKDLRAQYPPLKNLESATNFFT